jgi:dnd system-associated protein 4
MMTEIAISRDTVAIDEAVHDIYKRLTDGNDPVSVPFRMMKDVFMWAACLGYQMGERRPLTGKRVTVFRWAQFTPQIDIHLLKAIAIADSGDVNVLLDQEEILIAAEEYANAGIHELRAGVLEEYGQPLWNLVEQISNPQALNSWR